MFAAVVDQRKLCLIALLVTSAVTIVTTSPAAKLSLSGYLRITNCRNSNGSRVPCRKNDTNRPSFYHQHLANSTRRSMFADNSTPAVIARSHHVTTNNVTSSQDGLQDHVVTRPKHRLIRGSKQAATITRKELLKTDWCETQTFQQIIHEEGCLRTRLLNRFCYGQCNSFFIPKSEASAFGDTDNVDAFTTPNYANWHFRSCAVCTPKVTEWAVVVLRCPHLTPPFRRKRVQIVRQCKCMAVKLDSTTL